MEKRKRLISSHAVDEDDADRVVNWLAEWRTLRVESLLLLLLSTESTKLVITLSLSRSSSHPLPPSTQIWGEGTEGKGGRQHPLSNVYHLSSSLQWLSSAKARRWSNGRMLACHAGDPSSILGRRTRLFFFVTKKFYDCARILFFNFFTAGLIIPFWLNYQMSERIA